MVESSESSSDVRQLYDELKAFKDAHPRLMNRIFNCEQRAPKPVANDTKGKCLMAASVALYLPVLLGLSGVPWAAINASAATLGILGFFGSFWMVAHANILGQPRDQAHLQARQLHAALEAHDLNVPWTEDDLKALDQFVKLRTNILDHRFPDHPEVQHKGEIGMARLLLPKVRQVVLTRRDHLKSPAQ